MKYVFEINYQVVIEADSEEDALASLRDAASEDHEEWELIDVLDDDGEPGPDDVDRAA